MFLTEEVTVQLQSALVESPCTCQIALAKESLGQIVHLLEGVGVFITEEATVVFEGAFGEGPRASPIALHMLELGEGLPMRRSVSGCSSPSVRRESSSARSVSARAPTRSPWSPRTLARLFMDKSVC